MSQAISLVVYPVKDLGKAKALYGKWLGTEPYADAPYYVGFRVGDQEVGLDPNGHKQGMAGPPGLRTGERHRGEPDAAAGRGGEDSAGGEERRRRKAHRDGERPRRQPHRADADAVTRRGSPLPLALRELCQVQG
jgi:catechol 2,3-dioxygenase-like lactoylglutathione lyase family enzyme